MRVLGYVGILATIVILAVLLITVLRSMGGESVDTGEQKALKQLNQPGEEQLDPQSEIRDTVRDAMGR